MSKKSMRECEKLSNISQLSLKIIINIQFYFYLLFYVRWHSHAGYHAVVQLARPKTHFRAEVINASKKS